MEKKPFVLHSIAHQFRRHYLIASIIPIVFLLILIATSAVTARHYLADLITHATSDLNQDAEQSLQQLGETLIMSKAKDVARQIEMYFRLHPDKTFPEMRKDPLFMGLAIQKVGKTGYTALTEVNTWQFLVHPNAQLNDTDMRPLAKKMPDWWKIIEKAVPEERTASGYYNWREPDGSSRKKFMVVTPVGVKHRGITIWVSATTYIDEFSAPILEMRGKAEAIVDSYQKYVSKRLIWFGVFAGLIIFLTFAGIYLWGRRMGQRYIAPITQLAETAKQLGEGKWEAQLPDRVLQRKDEIGVMAQSFSRMSVQLKEAFSALEQRVTELNETQDALSAREELYRGIIENIVDAYYRCDREGSILMVSPSGVDLLGYDSENDLVGKDIVETVYYDPGERGKSLSILEERGAIRDYEIAMKHRNGSLIPVAVSSRYYYDDQGNVLGIEGIFRDIRERKRTEEEKRDLEERLQRAEKMEALGILAGGIAHDLNNILGIIVGYAEMLLLDEDKTQSIRPQLTNIMEGGQKAAAIVQDMLTLARRGVSGRVILNLNRIVADCQQSPEFAELASYHPLVRIKADLEPDLLNISGSAVHLGKTVFNLVSNASEAMPKGGFVTIKTANQYLDKPIQGYEHIREGDYVVLSVSDTGEGIKAADLKRIFEPFYTKKVMGRSGTGLGLAVVWGTVKDHNGYINVQSMEGNGSTFTLYLPVTREEITTEAVAVSMLEYMGHGESILIVDDVQGQRDLAADILGRLHYVVASVSSGEDAEEYLKTHRVDLLVLDMIMDPGMDGLDTYKKILEINPKQKAIIVSGFSESDRVKIAQALGAGAYVKKPYIIRKLGMAVRQELDRS